jgi:hypothetical protein
MNGNEMARLALIVSALGTLVGCGPSGERGPSGETYTYVLSTAHMPASAGGMGVGFNLDGAVSDGATEACNDAPDVTSFITGEPGVDNSVGSVVPYGGMDSAFRTAVEEQIAAGTLLLLIEVSDVDIFTSDASVGVRILLGTTTEPITLVGGRIAPGQTFTEGTVLANIAIGDAAITAGTLAFEISALPLSLTIDGTDLMLTLRDTHFRADISATGLTQGQIGGSLTVADVVQLADDLGRSEISNEEVIRSLGLPDLDPNAADDTVCNSISVGLSFEAVTANP